MRLDTSSLSSDTRVNSGDSGCKHHQSAVLGQVPILCSPTAGVTLVKGCQRAPRGAQVWSGKEEENFAGAPATRCGCVKYWYRQISVTGDSPRQAKVHKGREALCSITIPCQQGAQKSRTCSKASCWGPYIHADNGSTPPSVSHSKKLSSSVLPPLRRRPSKSLDLGYWTKIHALLHK